MTSFETGFASMHGTCAPLQPCWEPPGYVPVVPRRLRGVLAALPPAAAPGEPTPCSVNDVGSQAAL